MFNLLAKKGITKERIFFASCKEYHKEYHKKISQFTLELTTRDLSFEEVLTTLETLDQKRECVLLDIDSMERVYRNIVVKTSKLLKTVATEEIEELKADAEEGLRLCRASIELIEDTIEKITKNFKNQSLLEVSADCSVE